MRNFKRKIKTKYHEQQLSEIKDKIGIEKVVQQKRTRSKILIPSIISLSFSLAIIILVMSLSLTKKSQAPENLPTEDEVEIVPTDAIPNESDSAVSPEANEAISDLEENTSKYISSPIKTFTDPINDVYISIYYGIKKEYEGDDKHYIAIDYVGTSDVLIHTKVFSFEFGEEVDTESSFPMFDHSFAGTGDEISNFNPNSNLIYVQIMVNETSYEYSFDLNEYYEELVEDN